MIIEGRKNIANYLYMSTATFGRHRVKYGIPVTFGIREEDRHLVMLANTDELDAWKDRQEAEHGHR